MKKSSMKLLSLIILLLVCSFTFAAPNPPPPASPVPPGTPIDEWVYFAGFILFIWAFKIFKNIKKTSAT